MLITRSSVAKTGQTGKHQFIQESTPLQILKKETILIEENGQKRPVLRLAGRFQYADKQNSNGRIYETGILDHAVGEIQEDIKSRRVLGELDHPQDARIHLDRVSHMITKLWMENDEVLGELEVLDKTPCGSTLKALIEGGVSIGISSRGVGDMESTMIEGKECFKVLPGYTFVTFDIVGEPSVQGSYLSVMESRNRFLKTKSANEVYKTKESDLIKEIHNYLNKL